MQVIARVIKSCRETFRVPVVQQLQTYTENASVIESPLMHLKGLENTTVAEVLMKKEDEKDGPWLWCTSDDTVYDAAKQVCCQLSVSSCYHINYFSFNLRIFVVVYMQMARNNIGSLVVLKPGDEQMIAGIVTERGYFIFHIFIYFNMR